MRILYDSKHAVRVTRGVAHAERNIILRPTNAVSWFYGPEADFYISIHHVLSYAGNAGNECADIATSSGVKDSVAESNIPSFSLDRRF